MDADVGLPEPFAGWERAPVERETVARVPPVTVTAESVVYEPPGVADLKDAAAGDIDTAPRAAFRTGLSFSPPPPRAPTALLGIAARYARREFAKSLREDGLVDVRPVDRRRFRYDGGEGRAFRYRAGYPLAAGSTFECTVWAGIWPGGGSFEMGGGVFPAEAPPGDIADGTLAVAPDEHREETFAFMRALAKA